MARIRTRVVPLVGCWWKKWNLQTYSAHLSFRRFFVLGNVVCTHGLQSLGSSAFAFFLGLFAAISSSRPSKSNCIDTESGSVELSYADADVMFADVSPRCRRFIAWVLTKNIDVVVFDMDLTMGSGHCGLGLKREDLSSYIAGASPDFIEAVSVLSRIPGIKLAVATNSDPAEYDLPGQSRESHILGPDLAYELISHWCPHALPRFEIMVGFDHDMHKADPVLPGKSWHMRRIAEHYKASFHNMVLIDDTASRLENTDGWHGVLVRDQRTGFHFEDCFVDDCLAPRLRARHRGWLEPFMRGYCSTS